MAASPTNSEPRSASGSGGDTYAWPQITLIRF
jgi:hypothetical protein